jgi:hypothetical protein
MSLSVAALVLVFAWWLGEGFVVMEVEVGI